MSDEGVELRSPFPVVPPLKDSKWGDLPLSADGESRPVAPPPLLPDIGEPHPCPYFVGPDLNFVPEWSGKKPSPPPEKLFHVVPAIQPALLQYPRRSMDEEEVTFNNWLDQCLHGVVWECVTQHSRDMSKELFGALISNNPRKFRTDEGALHALRKKLFRKNNDSNWSEPCEPIDRLKFDVLVCQSYKLNRARYTLTNEALSDLHRKTVQNAVSQQLLSLYSADMEKKLQKEDSKEMKQHPPRMAP